ncbi:MAG TPA: helix-turn-helix transcriptional regulator [Anaerolineaceae bacterium]|nr:helix-turn-helix transcriptional regulator [Anaerolineaceae bacterium]
MINKIDYSFANSKQIEKDLGVKLEQIRLGHNMTQAELASKAGVSVRTIVRLEKGEGVSMDTFIRVSKALDLQEYLKNLLPDLSVRPIERVRLAGRERKRARPVKTKRKSSIWTWGEDKGDQS